MRPTGASCFFVVCVHVTSPLLVPFQFNSDRLLVKQDYHTGVLTGRRSAQRYPDALRRIRYHDAKTGKKLVFLTNNFTLPATTIADLYRCRWQVEMCDAAGGLEAY